jgi:hypothetical protein
MDILNIWFTLKMRLVGLPFIIVINFHGVPNICQITDLVQYYTYLTALRAFL